MTRGPSTVCQTSLRARRRPCCTARSRGSSVRTSGGKETKGAVRTAGFSRTSTSGPVANRPISLRIWSSPSGSRGASCGTTADCKTSSGASACGARNSASPSTRAFDSRLASRFAAREAKIRVARVAVVRVAVYIWDEVADVNHGSVVPIAVNHARSAIPMNTMPKQVVRMNGHSRVIPCPSGDGRGSDSLSSPYSAIDGPQDDPQGHHRNGPRDRIEDRGILIQRDRDRRGQTVRRFASLRVDRGDRVDVRPAPRGAPVVIDRRPGGRERAARESREWARRRPASIDVIADQVSGGDGRPGDLHDSIDRLGGHGGGSREGPRARPAYGEGPLVRTRELIAGIGIVSG